MALQIGILSDTHGYWDERFARHFLPCDAIFHCGDIGSMLIAERLSSIAPLYAVYGNIDTEEVRYRYSESLALQLEGVTIAMTHIGGYPGRYTATALNLIKRHRPQLMLTGHSHILKVMPDRKNQLLHINPGAAGLQGWQPVRTLVRLSLEQGSIQNVEVIELQ